MQSEMQLHKSSVCPLCQRDHVMPLFNKNGYQIVRCTDCDYTFIDPRPSEAAMKAYYDSHMYTRGNKYVYTKEGSALTYGEQINDERKLAYIRKFISSGALLDIGAAFGFFVHQAARFFDAQGVEPSHESVLKAHELDIPVREGTVDAIPESEQYDCIVTWDVIEHVFDPRDFVRKISKRLKSDGYLFISTGDASGIVPRLSLKHWALMTPPDHLQFFSKTTISSLLEQEGFKVLDIRHSGKSMTLEWFLFKLSDTFTIAPLRFLAQIVKKSGLKRFRVYVNTFDIMTVCAQKVRDIQY